MVSTSSVPVHAYSEGGVWSVFAQYQCMHTAREGCGQY